MAARARPAGAILDRIARLFLGGLLGGIIGGLVAGLGARLIMFGIRLVNPSFNGATTHNNVVNGQWTIGGTMNIVVSAVFLGAFGGWLYLLVRSSLVGPTRLRGVEFGLLLLVIFGSVVLDGNYEFTRFVPSWQSVSAFASLYVLYGVVAATMGDWVAPRPPRRSDGVGVWGGRVRTAVVVITFAIGAVGFVEGLRHRYGF